MNIKTLKLVILSIFLSTAVCNGITPAGKTIKKTEMPAQGQFLSENVLTKRAQEHKLKLPKPEKDGRYQTLNKRGAAIPKSNSFIDQFAKDIAKGQKKVLQIDATFGHQTEKSVSEDQLEYIVTDSSVDHLAIMASRLRHLVSEKSYKNLRFFLGSFPKDYAQFKENTFDAVLLNRVIHFYSPQQMTTTLKEVFRILKPGGKVYIIAVTPYVRRFESFIPLYKQRVLLKHSYPGHLKNLKIFANPEVTTPKQMSNLFQGEFMFYDAEVLYKSLTRNHFVVLRCNEFPITINSPTWKLDGRELVGAIAKKPIPPSLQDHVVNTPADF